MVTNKQVGILMSELKKGKTQETAAAKAGMTAKTARKYIQTDQRPSELTQSRNWRTHNDGFAAVWPELEAMLKSSPGLQATTLLEWLVEAYPGKFDESQLRTLQRQVRDWKALNGPEKVVIFCQAIPPGRQSQSDYTVMNRLGVTIAGNPFPHLVFHFMLPYSRWEYVTICYSESLDSLVDGYERAVYALGGVLREHRTDNLSAATKAFGNSRTFTEAWANLLAHYKVTPSRNNPGVSHENGSVEKSNDLFKQAVSQQLLLRGSKDFESVQTYEQFLAQLCSHRNHPRQARLADELRYLKPLPSTRWDAPTILPVRVSPESTIRVQGCVYSVPSRLISHQIKAYIYPTRVDIYYNEKQIESLPKRAKGEHFINYRHIIHHLVRKPGAFAYYKYREDLFPHPVFRQAYDHCVKQSPQTGHKRYLRLLELAAVNSEQDVIIALQLLLSAGNDLAVDAVKSLINTTPTVPLLVEIVPELSQYDELLSGGHHVH